MKLIEKILFESEEENLFKPRKIEDREKNLKKDLQNRIDKNDLKYFKNLWLLFLKFPDKGILDTRCLMVKADDKNQVEKTFKEWEFYKPHQKGNIIKIELAYNNIFFLEFYHSIIHRKGILKFLKGNKKVDVFTDISPIHNNW